MARSNISYGKVIPISEDRTYYILPEKQEIKDETDKTILIRYLSAIQPFMAGPLPGQRN